MECPQCHNETSEVLRYCEFCGSVLDVDEEQISTGLSKQALKEHARRSEETARSYLYIALFFLTCVIALRYTIARQRTYDLTPAYFAPPSAVEDIRTGYDDQMPLGTPTFELPGGR